MQHLFSMHTSAHSHNYRQTYVLLLLGFVFLTLAWLGMFNSFSIGVLLLGLGMLVVGLLNPRRFLSAGWLMASLGVATFLMFRHSIPDSQVLTAHLLAIGLGLLGIAWMARRGYIRAGALTPGFFVVGVGVTNTCRPYISCLLLWFLSRFPSGSLDLASLRLDWFLWLRAGEHTRRSA